MAERQDTQPDETEHPRNPPDAVINSRARNQAFWSYLGPLIALFAILAIALIYWLGRAPGRAPGDTSPNPIGTSGDQVEPAPSPNFESGGQDPRPHPRTTQEELERKGGTELEGQR
jgi:hypothetical protein